MVDLVLLLMAIASAISLLVLSPGGVQKKAIMALREYEKTDLSRDNGLGEDGQGRGPFEDFQARIERS
jgi:hypothetical protein